MWNLCAWLHQSLSFIRLCVFSVCVYFGCCHSRLSQTLHLSSHEALPSLGRWKILKHFQLNQSTHTHPCWETTDCYLLLLLCVSWFICPQNNEQSVCVTSLTTTRMTSSLIWMKYGVNMVQCTWWQTSGRESEHQEVYSDNRSDLDEGNKSNLYNARMWSHQWKTMMITVTFSVGLHLKSDTEGHILQYI